jgi:DNA-binding transcriptional MocR family regulator
MVREKWQKSWQAYRLMQEQQEVGHVAHEALLDEGAWEDHVRHMQQQHNHKHQVEEEWDDGLVPPERRITN